MKKQTRQQNLNSRLSDLQLLIPCTEGYHYQIEHNSVYGGYRLVKVNNNTGSHGGCFGGNGCEERVNFSTMLLKLNTIISTVKK
jgi:hypothetical protein